MEDSEREGGGNQQHPALHSPPSPLSQSYTHHSPLPSLAHQEDSNGEKTKFMVGIDEAGRGPALGPMVYAAAYCPVDWEQLSELGFNDSKVLTADTRTKLLGTLSAHPTHLGWSVQVLAPSSISQGMLARPPTNLNVQSQNATVHILRSLLQAGLNITQIFVDALGPSVPYQKYLQSLFPSAEVTVCPKADSIYEIVGAASVAAKTCRDAWMESWVWEEEGMPPGQELGSGYPSDPKTQAWIANRLEKTFGYPRLVRFSWAPIRLSMEKHGHVVKWMDDNQASVAKSFASATGRDKGRCGLAKDLGLRSVCDI
ncbi:ribonuclease H-like protein [Dacryopinax primogenitus]|uniref:Ribonuclease n=1 Tax=Dacryopinax primogenitus (strain DJM 731) TaxID=1858805 RepID=M5G9B9_DACPD|nr:ribonuclease H-like protein [Dacryopinax primogenitus]EJU04815.1 ribonuclease H-like protein [Dacryopinax primogenitus]